MRAKALRRTFAYALALATVACAGKVHEESTAGYDLAAAQSYAWVTDELELIQLGDAQPTVRTVDNEKRIRAAIEAALEARGLAKAPRDEATLHVAFSVGTVVRFRLEGGEDAWVPGLEPGQKQTKGTLHVYLLDRATGNRVWHAWTSKWLVRGDDPDTIVREAVGKIMREYPVAAR